MNPELTLSEIAETIEALNLYRKTNPEKWWIGETIVKLQIAARAMVHSL